MLAGPLKEQTAQTEAGKWVTENDTAPNNLLLVSIPIFSEDLSLLSYFYLYPLFLSLYCRQQAAASFSAASTTAPCQESGVQDWGHLGLLGKWVTKRKTPLKAIEVVACYFLKH